MKRIFKLLPELQGEELVSIQQVIKEMDDEEAETFATIYRARRKDPQTILVMCLVGLFLLPGLQRFFLDQIGMGILYLFTAGLCLVGSIVDLVNYKKLTQTYNANVIREVMSIVATK